MSPDPVQLSVLVVDNDPSLLALIAAQLRNSGFSCTSARSGSEGARRFEIARPDLVITDLNMPDGDGETLVRYIRTHAETPIILISAYPNGKQTITRHTNTRFLRKPFESRELIDLVSHTLTEATPQAARTAHAPEDTSLV